MGTLLFSGSGSVYRRLRAEIGLLTPAQIGQEREALNLTQKELSKLLHIAESTLSRWETGGQIQQRSLDTFLRCFFSLREVRHFLHAPLDHDLAVFDVEPADERAR